jgi:glycyl-tRNA synthetase
MSKPSLEQLVALAKRRGFVYPTSEIYGGLANSYDYGPLGAQLLKNIRDAWWSEFVEQREDMVGVDSQILLHPQTWVASGHVDSFSDPLVEDTISKKRYRADHVIEAWIQKHPKDLQIHVKDEIKIEDRVNSIVIEDLTTEEMGVLIKEQKILSPEGNSLSEPKTFNLLFESSIGTVVGEKSKIYLRGETAQGIFTNFKQVLDSTRVQLPFGIGQMGKSFRNEITTGQFIFRTLELEQAEIEYFFDPEVSDWQILFKQWQEAMWQFVTKTLGIDEQSIRWRQHTDKERSFYSKDTYDLDFEFSFGWKELWGVAYRSDYDLLQHAKYSGEKLEYRDPHTNKVFVPHVIEPALGIGRAFLMVLTNAYWEDKENNRVVLKIKPSLAPNQVAVFPLLKNKPELVAKARQVFKLLKKDYRTSWDDRGNIGKRYLYQDEIGTPYCVTVDFDTLSDDSVTVRHRDTTQQERISIDSLLVYLDQKITT